MLAEFLVGPLSITGGAASAELPNTCGKADDGFDPPRTLTLTLTPTDVTAVVVAEKGRWRITTSSASPTEAPTRFGPWPPLPTPATSEPAAPAPRDPVTAGGERRRWERA